MNGHSALCRRSTIKVAIYAGAASCALITAPPVLAQSTASAQPTADTEQAADNAQQIAAAEIIVTAQRRSQRLTEVPISIQAITGDTLAKTGIQTSVDFLKITPSVNFVSGFTPAATSVTIRGISSVAQEGGVQPSTAVIVDDVPLSKQGEFLSDFGDIERIEVLRGPQGTLFGKNATAGVINIVTNKPKATYEGRIETGYTTDNEKFVRGMVNIPLGDTIRTRFNAFYRDQSGILPNHAEKLLDAKFRNGNGEKTWGFSGKIAVDLSDATSLLLSADYFRQNSLYGGNVILTGDSLAFLRGQQIAAGVIADPNHPFLNSDSGAYTETKGYGVSLKLESTLSDTLKISSITAARYYGYDNYTDADGGPWNAWTGIGFVTGVPFYPAIYIATSLDSGLPRAPDKTKYWSEELKLNYSSGPIDAVGGVFIQQLVNNRHNSVPYVLYFYNAAGAYLNNLIDSRVSDDIYSAYGDVTYRITPVISAFGGLRFSYERLHADYHSQAWFGGFGGAPDTFDPLSFEPTSPPDLITSFSQSKDLTNLSGRAGLRYVPDSRHNYYVSYSRGYKGPAANISRAANPQKPFLEPEIANAFELGTKHILFDGNATANLALFYQTVQNVQQSAVIPGTTQTGLQNAGDIRSYGAEFDFAARVGKLTLDGGLSWVHAEYRNFINACYVGQTAAQGCNYDPVTGQTVAGTLTGFQNETGVPAVTQPRFSTYTSLRYDVNTSDSIPFDLFLRGSVSYKSSTPFGLNGDPMLVQPSYALVDLQLGITGKENKWQLLFFVNNLTDKAYTASLVEADNFIGRRFANYDRGFKRYGGVTLTASF